MFGGDYRHIATLTITDLRFEWILSLCMILALGAVFAPMFILLGLQEGIVGNMLDKLKNDPASRLVTPKFPLNEPLDDVWLRILGKMAAVVIESPTSHLLLDVEGYNDLVNTVPTTSEDPLLTENGISLSGQNRPIILSDRLAQLSAKKVGDPFVVTLIRNLGAEERIPIKMQVVGILPLSVSETPQVWLPDKLFLGFYKWRRGLPAPEIGLGGTGTGLTPEYDGIITLLEKVPPNEEYREMIAGKLSFSQLPIPLQNSGWILPHDRKARLWRPINNRVFQSDFQSLINRHNELGYPVEVIPFLDPFEVKLKSANKSVNLSITLLPEKMTLYNDHANPEGLPCVWASPEDDFEVDVTGTLSFKPESKGPEIEFPVRICFSHRVLPSHLAVPWELAGKMNAVRHQGGIYDSSTGEFCRVDEGTRFFRAYAKSIDELENLVEFVRQEGIRRANDALRQPVSKLHELRNIRMLAHYMAQIYFLVVLVSGVSGFFAITASVYAGVQRRRHDLAYLELLGLNPGALFLFPCLKSLILVTGGVASALIAYAFFDLFSARLFVHLLGENVSLSRLTLGNLFLLTTGIFIVASIASLVAAIAVVRIEPGEYIHE